MIILLSKYPIVLGTCFATHLLDGGTDIEYIQELLGHADVRSTMIYIRENNRKISNIMNPLDLLINRDHFNNKEKSGS